MGWLTNMARDGAEELMTNKIKRFDGVLLKLEGDYRLFHETIDLGGFKSLNLTLIGPLDINTNEGCTVNFKTDQGVISLESDEQTIETDFSQSLGLGLLCFSIDMEEVLEGLLETDSFRMEIIFKKQVVRFQ
jgi:hypothetical protein